MLDITHYLLEEDSLRGIAMAEDPADTVAKMRAGLYRSLYKRGHGINSANEIEVEDGVTYADEQTASGPIRASNNQVQPYIPPTEMTDNEALPYGNVVGAPLGF